MTAPDRPEKRQHADYVALNVEPFEGSCDCCAESEKRIVHTDPDTSAYICEDCIALEEKAISAAACALIDLYDYGQLPAVELARIAINAYIQAKWQAEHSDGEVSS